MTWSNVVTWRSAKRLRLQNLFISAKRLHLARLQQSHIVGVHPTQRGQGGVNRVAGLIQQSHSQILWQGTPYPNFDWKVWPLIICLETFWKFAPDVDNQIINLKKKIIKIGWKLKVLIQVTEWGR